MKKPKDVSELASRLTKASAASLVPAPAPPEKHKTQSVPVFLRLSKDLYDRYDAEAIRRTKEKGRGVSVQQVILDRLAEAQP